MENDQTQFFATQAWLDGAWVTDVLLSVGADGTWNRVQANVALDQCAAATRLAGSVLPGVVNAHSHAFQRGIAGLTEHRGAGAPETDDFWSWRERMYAAANRITPEQLEVVAAHLYAELLMGGYTHVCEFQYLHHHLDGSQYEDPTEMSMALVRAARSTGIGLTLLPTLYMRSGFTAIGSRDDQRRFVSSPLSISRIVESVRQQTAGDPNINVGVAIHSLRAVSTPALRELAEFAKNGGLPLHIHVAEQTREVEESVAHSGLRPIEWLLEHANIDERWNLVHATHATAAELAGVKARGASIVICPSTEANLGDGVFDLPAYAALGGRWSIGSDSHVTRAWPDELRLLEYSQRLRLRERNVAARILGHESSAGGMLQAVLDGGCAATGRPMRGIAVGQRADFVTLDAESTALLGVPSQHTLDALVFSASSATIDGVYVAGQRQLPTFSPAFKSTMQELWGPRSDATGEQTPGGGGT